MTQDNDDDDDRRPIVTFSELMPIFTAAIFTIGFFAALVWVLVTNDPWHDFIPKGKPQAQETPGVVPVTLPEKGRN